LAERLSGLAASEGQARDRLQAAVANKAQATALARDAGQNLASARHRRDAAAADHERHMTERPGWFARLFRTARFRTWREVDVAKYAVMQQATEALERAITLAADANKHLKQTASATAKATAELETASEQLSEAARMVGAAREKLGAHFVDQAFFEREHADRHQLSPWLDASAHRVREMSLSPRSPCIRRSLMRRRGR
jgi:hypothetical protein